MGPYLSAPVPFVRHDATGRITERGRMEPQYIAAEDAERGGILAGEGAEDTHHVEDPTGPARRLRLRRSLVVAFDTREPAPGAPARVVLPPNTAITVTGPVTGTARASGATDLVLMVPGTYTLIMEVWPRRPAVETLTVPIASGPVPEAPSGAVVIGPGLEVVRARAKETATDHYARLALISRPAGLQAADLLKAAEAERVIAGEPSEWIAEEAAGRGQEPKALAEAIVAESAKTVARERERTRLTSAIARATTESEVVAALQAVALEFTLPPGP